MPEKAATAAAAAATTAVTAAVPFGEQSVVLASYIAFFKNMLAPGPETYTSCHTSIPLMRGNLTQPRATTVIFRNLGAEGGVGIPSSNSIP